MDANKYVEQLSDPDNPYVLVLSDMQWMLQSLPAWTLISEDNKVKLLNGLATTVNIVYLNSLIEPERT